MTLVEPTPSTTAREDDALLEVRELSVTFGGGSHAVHAVNGVSFALRQGESLGIVGESGSGKSVSVQALMGLLPTPPARVTGEALFRGQDLLSLPAAKMRRVRGRQIAMVFQDPMTSLNPVLTVGRQLTEALEEHEGIGERAAQKRAAEMLDLVGIANPAARMKTHPHQFSGGQLQRIGIAMALVCRPSILIADEPTTALDVTIQAQIVELVAKLQKELGMAIIWISHDLALVSGLVDRVVVMYGGMVVEMGPVHRLFANTTHPYTVGLLHSIPSLSRGKGRLVPIPGTPPDLRMALTFCPFAPRCALVVARCKQQRPPLEAVAPGHAAACWERQRVDRLRDVTAGVAGESAPRRASPLLEVTGLKVHFPIRKGVLKRRVGAVRAVDGVDFTVFEGETLALVGESGCGKSTTGRAVLGLEKPDAGRIVFGGEDFTDPGPALQAMRRRRMQMVFQNPYGALNPRMTVGRIVGEGLRAQRVGTAASREERVRELLALVGLAGELRARYPFELSGGQRQRVGIARALAAAPQFIIADEPISALDVSIQAQVVNLLDDLKEKLGLTYLFIGHDLSMVRYLSDRVAVMYLGRIVEIGPTGAVFDNPLHPYTSALLSAVPIPDPASGRSRIVLPGGVPDPANPPPGCAFHPRCSRATEICRRERPVMAHYGQQHAACHHAGDV